MPLAETRSAGADAFSERAQVRQLEADKLRTSAAWAPSSHGATPAPPSPLPSPEALLPDIVRLWHELHVPLLARSQFLVAHDGREPYFFAAEHEHLLELQRCDPAFVSTVCVGSGGWRGAEVGVACAQGPRGEAARVAPGRGDAAARARVAHAAAQAGAPLLIFLALSMDLRKFTFAGGLHTIAQLVRHAAGWCVRRWRPWLQVFSEADRERLFALWHIKQIKTRKKALSLRLWDPAVRAPLATCCWLCRRAATPPCDPHTFGRALEVHVQHSRVQPMCGGHELLYFRLMADTRSDVCRSRSTTTGAAAPR